MRKAAPSVTLRHMGLTPLKMIDMPPVWLLGFAVLVWGVGQVMPWPLGLGLVHVVGTGCVVLGVGIILLAAVQFRQHKTTIIPHQTASHLLTSGLFALSRNPIYLADAIILAGLCLRWDVVHGLVLVPLFVFIIQRRFIYAEEARLGAAFGAEFGEYARTTRRWI